MTGTNSNCDKKIAHIIKDIQSEIINDDSGERTERSPISRQNVLFGNLVKILLDDCSLQLSNATAEKRVRETIQEMMEENTHDGYDDPVSRFRCSWPELSGSSSSTQFTVLIPLPISGRTRSLPNKIEFNGQTLTRISLDQWGKYADIARTTLAEDIGQFPKNLDQFEREPQFNGVNSSEYTFWRFDNDGIDPDYVLQQVRTVLNILLGQLSFVADYYSQINIDYSRNLVQERTRTTFCPPPFYFLFHDIDLYRIHPETYPVDKPIPRIKEDFNYNEWSDMFSSLGTFNEPENSIHAKKSSVHMRSIEATVGSAISTFGQAMRQNDPESMFLWLYRTLEHITFTKYAESRESLERAVRILDIEHDDRLNNQIDTIKDRRNTLVHDGTDIEISQSELNLLKSLTIATIDLVGHSYSKNVDVIITKMTTGDFNESMEDTLKKMDRLENKLKVLEEAQDTEF